MKTVALVILVSIVSITVNWLALLAGWWWITVGVGLLVGLFLRPASLSLWAAFWIGGLSWSLPLLILAIHAPVVRVADVVESIVGISDTGGILILVLTVVLGCVLSLGGTWVGITGRKVFWAAYRQKRSYPVLEA